MSHTNTQLQALLESVIAYAMTKNWKVAEVEAAFSALMEPMRRREANDRVEHLYRTLTPEQAENMLIHAMAERWKDNVMSTFFAALKLRFPTRCKTIDNIDDWAGAASNEASEHGGTEEYEKLADKALKALCRLPWPKPVQVDPALG